MELKIQTSSSLGWGWLGLRTIYMKCGKPCAQVMNQFKDMLFAECLGRMRMDEVGGI